MTTPTDPPAPLKLAREYRATMPTDVLRAWAADAAAALAAIDALPAPSGEPAERTLLEQYDREQLPGYRQGYEDGRQRGYTVGHRHGLEQAASYAVPAAQAAASPEPTAEQKRAGARAWAEAIADPDMSPADKVAHVYRAMLGALPAQAAPAPQAEPVGGKWEGAEEWMPLAWGLCADECGEEACTELVWEGGPVPEPWGDRWLKYEDEAKRLIALVRKHVPAAQPAPAAAAPVQPLTADADEAALYRWLRDTTHPDNLRKLFNGCQLPGAAEIRAAAGIAATPAKE